MPGYLFRWIERSGKGTPSAIVGCDGVVLGCCILRRVLCWKRSRRTTKEAEVLGARRVSAPDSAARLKASISETTASRHARINALERILAWYLDSLPKKNATPICRISNRSIVATRETPTPSSQLVILVLIVALVIQSCPTGIHPPMLVAHMLIDAP